MNNSEQYWEREEAFYQTLDAEDRFSPSGMMYQLKKQLRLIEDKLKAKYGECEMNMKFTFPSPYSAEFPVTITCKFPSRKIGIETTQISLGITTNPSDELVAVISKAVEESEP